MQTFQHQTNLIGIFAQHKVAANLLMMMMLLSGIWALSKLNTQFFPTFALEIITVRVVWSGATAEDVQTAIIRPLEQQLRTVDGLRKITATSAENVASLTLEYQPNKDMGEALDNVKEKVALLRNLPLEAEEPEISRVIRYDPIARLLITGPDDPAELRHLAQQIERELLQRGVSQISISGLPEEEISIQIPQVHLEELGLTLGQVSEKIKAFSQDIPAGSIGQEDATRQLRSLAQSRDQLAFMQLPLVADEQGRLLRLGDIAQVERRAQDGEVLLTHNHKPAIELLLQRAESDDALKSANILQTWLKERAHLLPANIELKVYDQYWELIQERISLLLNNGISGLILVVAVLFIFLNGRVAFWVAVGIPVSLMGMLAVLYMVGGSINMISLFAMIMALGIVVDDAIVVGEDAFSHFQMGERSLLAAEGGAQRMLAPVMAASLTTISAFLPLMLISGTIGNILIDIPIVMICVIIASLVECFFILPGHLRHTFHQLHHAKPHRMRQRLEYAYDQFRDQWFRPVVEKAIAWRWSVLSGTAVMMLLTVGLLAGGRVSFTFFPSPDGKTVLANASFASGTPKAQVDTFLNHLYDTLYETQASFPEKIVNVVVVRHGSTAVTGAGGARSGDQFGSLMVELTSPDSREVRNQAFIRAWRERVQTVAGLETLTISEQRGGPPGRDIEVRFMAEDPYQVKAASLALQTVLRTFEGVSAIEDDMPYGQEQWIFTLTPQGKALGLTVASVGQQLRAAYDGQLVQIFQDGDDEVEVRVSLPDGDRYRLASLQQLTLQLPNGGSVPFTSAVTLTTQRGFEALRRAQGRLAAQVSADVDAAVTNANEILANLEENVLPELVSRYGVEYSFEGRAADQMETLGDMKRGLFFALILMYLILAWQFSSYGWPLLVLSVIPFGLVGAVFGHWVMGIDLTILSLFGFFGLSGIVVNDSIVLVTFYQQLRAEGMAIYEALIEASCQRLRAVLLTSLTTIFGLTPLLFETSLQAQFLIPMATSIAFGLMFSTILVLFAVPVLLSIYEDIMSSKAVEKSGVVLAKS
jgi:multidrug efflux pump subunit AcrB